MQSDAVVMAVLSSRKPLGIGVQHGHKPMSKPLVVTKAEGGTVHEIDGKLAFQVWKDVARAVENGRHRHRCRALERGRLTAARFEIGLIAGANQYKIRAPLSADANGSLSRALRHSRR